MDVVVFGREKVRRGSFLVLDNEWPSGGFVASFRESLEIAGASPVVFKSSIFTCASNSSSESDEWTVNLRCLFAGRGSIMVDCVHIGE